MLTKAGVGRVGIEATGGYEQGVVACLRQGGLCVVILQPVQVKAFARLHLRRAKNDTLDAALIAACTVAVKQPHAPPDPRLAELADVLTFVEQIEDDIRRLKTRPEHVTRKDLRRLMELDLKRLAQRRQTQLQRIAQDLRRHADLGRKLDLLLGIPGIGERTALAILLRLPELGTVSREQVAALAGLAPFDNDSGARRGERHIAGGRSRLRCSLYAAALPASFHCNPALIALYRRLKEKSHKQALVACAGKLLIMANAVVARDAPWQARPA